MVIRQGDLFWVNLGEPNGSESGFLRPYVIIQNNVFNTSKINTVIVCPLTSNLKRGSDPGNVLLEKKEANLDRPSVVNVTQITTIDKSLLQEKIGTLSKMRVNQILVGINLVLSPKEID